MYTGKVIIVEKDINPNSPTYGQTRERLEDSELCTHWKCEMQKVNTYAYDGVWYEVYADKNPTSPTYGKTITIERGSTDPFYLEMYSRCEQLRYHEDFVANSGYKVATNIDANPNSPTYQQPVENVRSLSLIDCARPNTNQIIEDEVECELVDFPSGQKGTNGVAIVKGYDVNPYSTTYYEKIYEYRRASKDCFSPDTTPNIIVACEFCEVNQQGKTTGYKFIKQKDINLFSTTYDAEWQLVKVADTDMCAKVKSGQITGYMTAYGNYPITVNGIEYRVESDRQTNYFEIQVFDTIESISLPCPSLRSIDISGIDLTACGSFYRLFAGAVNLRDIELGKQPNLPNLTLISDMFQNCRSYSGVLDFSGWGLTEVTNASAMFRGCNNVDVINLSNCGLGKLEHADQMFYNCNFLREIHFDNCDLTALTDTSSIFYNAGSATRQLTIYARGCNATTLMKLAALKPTYANIVTT